jgi:hypothetical protein
LGVIFCRSYFKKRNFLVETKPEFKEVIRAWAKPIVEQVIADLRSADAAVRHQCDGFLDGLGAPTDAVSVYRPTRQATPNVVVVEPPRHRHHAVHDCLRIVFHS